jgi:riboflavin kinase / FMN adenylyltransferase
MMRVVYGVKCIDKKPMLSAVAVGIFDGLHIGHKKIITTLMRVAKDKRLLPVVITFNPHPDDVLSKKKKTPMLCSLQHRLNLFASLGIRLCVVLNFDRTFAEKTCDTFIKDILIKKLGMKSLVVGESFSFGRERVSGIDHLKKAAGRMGFNVSVIFAKRYNRRIISSSAIRSLIEKGRLDIASKLLGRPVSVLGTVIHGRKRGRIIGFKTANIDPHHEAIPPSGAYAAYTLLGYKRYKSVVNIGRRPTFFEKDPSIEVHIFGINRNIYGKDIEVFFIKRLRPERRFRDEDKLRDQIKKDALRAEKTLKGS